MADTTWVWFGNIPVVNNPTNTIPSTAQTNTLQNTKSSAEGIYNAETNPNGMRVVNLTGTTPSANNNFNHTYQSGGNTTPSQFSYTSPISGAVTGSRLTSVFQVNLTMTNENGDNFQSVGFVMQMTNGDLFFRPSSSALNGSGLTNYTLTSMSFSGATPVPSTSRLLIDAFNPTVANVHVPCFTSGTLIRTASGDKQIEDLVVGDTVTTADHGEQVVRWIKSRTIDSAGLRAFPNLRPVRISAGALGGGLPVQDLLVSPQHRVLVRSKIAATMFGEIEVLVAAKHLIDMPGIAIADDVTEVTYWHFLCDAHEVVFANDAPAETLYTGAVALMSVGLAAREEIFTLFPELRTAVDRPCGARMMLTGRQGRKLAERHAKNVRTLVAAE